MNIFSITPALNEEESIGRVLQELKQVSLPGAVLKKMIVVDNGSSDQTARVALEAGAQVVAEPERGYGAACLRGMQELDESCDVVLFVDADGSDVPAQWAELLVPLLENEADIVVGSRTQGQCEKGALEPHQRFGNWLSSLFLRFLYGEKVTDLGPFRAIRKAVLESLCMDDRNYGWTVQMQARALQRGFRYREVPVRYRCRQAGVSKISGNLWASFLAGKKILRVIFLEYFLRTE